jgi:hypothetical protein
LGAATAPSSSAATALFPSVPTTQSAPAAVSYTGAVGVAPSSFTGLPVNLHALLFGNPVSTMAGLQLYSFGSSLPFIPTPLNMVIAPFVSPLAPVPAPYYAPPIVAPSPPPAPVYTSLLLPLAPVIEPMLPLASPGMADAVPEAELVSDPSSRPVHLTNLITARLSLDN